jgi:hypothetical protein
LKSWPPMCMLCLQTRRCLAQAAHSSGGAQGVVGVQGWGTMAWSAAMPCCPRRQQRCACVLLLHCTAPLCKDFGDVEEMAAVHVYCREILASMARMSWAMDAVLPVPTRSHLILSHAVSHSFRRCWPRWRPSGARAGGSSSSACAGWVMLADPQSHHPPPRQSHLFAHQVPASAPRHPHGSQIVLCQILNVSFIA